MKKLFTLVALLAMVLGANAQEWEKVASIDFTTYQGFPHYVMGYVPEFDNGWMTDYGANYKYVAVEGAEETSDVIVKTQNGTEYYRWTEGGGWHQYFVITGIPTIIDGKYKVKALVRASEAVSVPVQMRWSWNEDPVNTNASFPQSDDFVEVEWQYEGIGGNSCDLIAQPGGFTGVIEWKSLEVYQMKEEGGHQVEWKESIANGDAEAAWPAWSLEEIGGINTNWRTDRAPEICAWALTMGKNKDAGPSDLVSDDRSRPFPADIEEEAGNPSNHVFAVHVTEIDKIDDDASVAWSNQFWIQSSKEFKAGEKVKIKFRYKTDVPCSVATQWHKMNPSVYLNWTGVGNLDFTTEWQEFDKTVTLDSDGTWSLAFNLNNDATNARTAPMNFYFDDFSWQYMVLDEGYFVAGINTNETKEYTNLQLDEAIQLVYDEEEEAYVATIGTKGDAKTYVDQVMVSTKRGDAQAYKANTLKPEKNPKECYDVEWLEYQAASNQKVSLPGLGVWKVTVDEGYHTMGFELLEGTPYEEPDPVDIVTNKTEIVVKGAERDDLSDMVNGQEQQREEVGGTGEAWDNQFWFKANRKLAKGEATHLVFKYKANKEAKTSTQCHGEPGAYMHWAAIGDVTFTEDWQDFDQDFTVPDEADGMQTIAFNMAEIKEACDYEITDVQWYLKDENNANNQTLENLINETGTENFWVKIGAGTSPYQYGTDPSGIKNVVNKSNNGSAVIYNLAGQRVSKDYKGIVVKDNKKVVLK